MPCKHCACLLRCMSPKVAQTGGWRTGRACPLCPGRSDINLFRYCQSIIYFDAEIYSSVTEDEKHVPLVRALESGRLSDHCGLGIRLGCKRPVAIDLGCVKTCAHEKRAEWFSLLSYPDNPRQRFCFSN